MITTMTMTTTTITITMTSTISSTKYRCAEYAPMTSQANLKNRIENEVICRSMVGFVGPS